MKRRFPIATWISMVCLSVAAGFTSAAWGQAAGLNRTVLPIPEPSYPHSKVLDARDANPPA